MCGIAGIVGKSDTPALTAMLDAARHRGPDDEGIFSVPGKLTMGMVRLSIIDLETGNQPVGNEDGSVQVICNGEIYNYLELNSELKARGHIFKTNSDTETIVHLYEELAEDCVLKLNGMFSFALWDGRKSRLMLARDRLGIKPLYYAFHQNNFYFASEINAILSIPGFDRQLNTNSLYNYLSGFVAIGEDTAFNNIHRFPPAQIAWVRDGRLHFKRYWNLNFTPKINYKDENKFCEEFRELFNDAVRIQLRADVPVGVFLSGGIDSAAVAERAIRHLGKLKTFSLGFFREDEGEVANELEYAKKTAEFLGTDHYEFRIGGNTAGQFLKSTIRSFGDLYSGPTPQYFLAELASRHVKVALSGLGGDELFGSYGRPYRFKQSLGKVPLFIWNCFNGRFLDKIPVKYFSGMPGRLGRIVRRTVFPGEVYSDRAEAVFKKTQRQSILRRDIVEHLDNEKLCETIYQNSFNQLYSLSVADKIMATDIKTQLVDEYLAYTDSFTMAHSLETRVPFLDHRLVEWAACLPVEKRACPGDPKYLLKRALSTDLPQETFYRPKMGFSLPFGKWLENSMSPFIGKYFSIDYLEGQRIFDMQKVLSIIKDFKDGRRGRTTYQLWSLLVFQIWYDIYFNPH